MADFTWLAEEAKNIHQIFTQLFYLVLVVMLLIGVLIEYFRLPLGQLPSFPQLVGRCFIAALLLHAYPEISNFLADFTDSLSDRLGDLHQIKHVLSRMGDKLGDLTWSWVSVKDTMVMALSFLSFFALYFSVYVCEAFMLYTWTLLFIFSPMLIALFVLPQTAGATKALFRSLIEVACWKITWSVLATLLWSSALSTLNNSGDEVNFITVVCFNIILAGSLILTPIVVHNLAGSGLASMVRTVGGVAIGASVIGPAKVLRSGANIGMRSYNTGVRSASYLSGRYFPKAHEHLKKAPLFNVRPTRSLFASQKSKLKNQNKPRGGKS